jgi:DNA-binding IclR family transcriptional regulator
MRSYASVSSGTHLIPRVLAVLRALAEHREGLVLRQLSAVSKVPRSTVQRIVEALERENVLMRSFPSGRGVRLGPALIALADAAKEFDLVEVAHPLLLRLAANTGETADLSVLSRGKAIVVDQVPGRHTLRAVSAVGETLPLHCTASGKALLAALTDDWLSTIRERVPLVAMTKNSIRQWSSLHREILEIRQTGIAFDKEERFPGICSIAAALVGPGKEVVAVSLPTPRKRFLDQKKEMMKALMECCRKLQDELRRPA